MSREALEGARQDPPETLVLCIAVLALLLGYVMACYAYFILGHNGANLAFLVLLSNIFVIILGVKYGDKVKDALGKLTAR